ncbi:hypothetical protein [Streptomyces sp. NPDC005181]|uniref:hypothetical protein n=1 Tax=Streptomyces sp. NPDC005181 TaxID=3156869 RepID=UPI0033AC3FC4
MDQGSGALMPALAVTLLVGSGVLTWRARQVRPAYGGAADAMPSQPAWKDRV